MADRSQPELPNAANPKYVSMPRERSWTGDLSEASHTHGGHSNLRQQLLQMIVRNEGARKPTRVP